MRGKLLEDLEELVFNQRRWKLVPQRDVIFGNFMMWVKQCHLYHPPGKPPFFLGGMVTIPRKWVVYCFTHIKFNMTVVHVFFASYLMVGQVFLEWAAQEKQQGAGSILYAAENCT